MFALTNAHGLRLALVSGRIGIPPRSAAPAADAASLAGGLPVVTAGPAPFALPGTEGPVVALEVRPGSVVASDAPLWVLDRPLAISAARVAIFATDQGLREFTAGLDLLGVNPRGLRLRADPSAFGGLWVAEPEVLWDASTAKFWSLHLDRQERVSAALLLGDLVARGQPWQAAPVASLRKPLKAGARLASKQLRQWARAFAALDFIDGWAPSDLADTLDDAGHSLGEFARRHSAAVDPLFPTDPPVPSNHAEKAAAFLLDHQGLMAGAVVESLAAVSRDDQTSLPALSAALIGLGIGRSLISQRYRPAARDARLVRSEIDAAARALNEPRGSKVGER